MKQLDPKAVWLFFFNSVISFLTLFIILSAYWFISSLPDMIRGGTDPSSVLGFLWLIVPLAIIFAFIWAKLTYHFYRYELTEQGFRKESGVIWKKYVTIPYARIQNVDINRGILARILGLSDLHIQTAGASAVFSQYGAIGGVNAEGRLPGLSKADAEVLRDELVRRAGKSSGQGV